MKQAKRPKSQGRDSVKDFRTMAPDQIRGYLAQRELEAFGRPAQKLERQPRSEQDWAALRAREGQEAYDALRTEEEKWLSKLGLVR
jgi:hypothetical protein